MALDGVVERCVPRVKLEPSLTAESLARALQRWAREGFDGFAGNGSRHRVSEMDLAFPLAFSEPPIQKPGGVDQEGLLAKAAGVKIGGRVDGVVGVGFESHRGTK